MSASASTHFLESHKSSPIKRPLLKMPSTTASYIDVLIIGAGPSGLVFPYLLTYTLWTASFGVTD